MFQIESNIPVPASGKRTAVYPYKAMGVGDSFMLQHEDSKRAFSRLAASSGSYARKNGVKFAVRKVAGGARVWRIA